MFVNIGLSYLQPCTVSILDDSDAPRMHSVLHTLLLGIEALEKRVLPPPTRHTVGPTCSNGSALSRRE